MNPKFLKFKSKTVTKITIQDEIDHKIQLKTITKVLKINMVLRSLVYSEKISRDLK